jgi:hypothetical protein
MRSQQFRQAVAKPKALPPEYNPWFWNPARFGVRFADEAFRSKLKALGDELDACWNPITERWQIFAKAPKIQHKICTGWRLLHVVRDASGAYMPLDERTLARLYQASVFSAGTGKQYFDRIVSEMERDKERRDKQYQADLIDEAMPSWHHSQISVSGYGKSNGSKFSTYHA